MRTCRFRLAGHERYGVVEGEAVRALTAAPWAGGLPEGKPVPLADVTLLAPVEPSKVVCVGRNYLAHARELGNEVPAVPLIFLKPSTSVVGPQDADPLPGAVARGAPRGGAGRGGGPDAHGGHPRRGPRRDLRLHLPERRHRA